MQLLQGLGWPHGELCSREGPSELPWIEERVWTLVFPHPSPHRIRECVKHIKCGIRVRESKYLNSSKSWWTRGSPSVRRNKTKLISHLWNLFHGSVTSATQQPCILATDSGLYACFAPFPTGVKASLLPVPLFFCHQEKNGTTILFEASGRSGG